MEYNYPSKSGIDTLLKTAFAYWSKTLKFQLLFSVIYLSILLTVYYVFAFKLGLLDEIRKASASITDLQQYNREMMKISQTPQWQRLSFVILGTLVFLFPLNIGIFKIFRKTDLRQKLELSDLFAGYSGLNFFKFISFYLFWMLIYLYSFPTVILGMIWVFVTLFSAPLMFFQNKRFFETFSLNLQVLKLHFLEIFVCVLVGICFKYSGILLCGIGFLATFPFFNAVIYTMYQRYFKEEV